jgi:hypothetical protein
MDNALTLIKKFAQEKKVTLKIEKGEAFFLDKEESFLAKRGGFQLFC